MTEPIIQSGIYNGRQAAGFKEIYAGKMEGWN